MTEANTLNISNMGKEYKEFQKKIYDCLVDYKEKHITRDCSKFKGEENPGFLPEKFWDEELPAMVTVR